MAETVELLQLPAFCQKLVKKFSRRQLVLLDGPLGAGKTQFVKECVALMTTQIPDSPTFSVINSYTGADRALFHVDLYRMESPEDIESTGFWDLFYEEEGLIFVEWANKVPVADWPKSWNCLSVKIELCLKPTERLFVVS